jgi:ABC-type Zn2+ transport system substrate-binding protein/surface adhesin
LAEAYEDDEDDDHDHNHDHDHDCDSCSCGDEEKNIYIMKVVMDGDEETFVPVEEDKMEELIGAVENLYTNDEFDDEE